MAIIEAHEHVLSVDVWPFKEPTNMAVFTTSRVIEDGYPILLVSHDDDDDGDWQFLCGTTTDTKDCRIVCFACVYERDKGIGTLADLPAGWQAWRDSASAQWERFPRQEESSDK